ncbi:MAG: hypothetical protein AAB870_00255, partial [Patescibacteria group bacterium]
MDFGEKGNRWLELSKQFFFRCSEGETVARNENLFEKKDFLKKLGSNHIISDRGLGLDFKKPFEFVFEFKDSVGVGPLDPKIKNTPEGRISYSIYTELRDKGSNLDSQIQNL